jgi:hypothetical protein
MIYKAVSMQIPIGTTSNIHSPLNQIDTQNDANKSTPIEMVWHGAKHGHIQW